MSEKIIYANRPFREEFIKKIREIAPDYVFKTELQPEEIEHVEISLGWDRNYQEDLLASSHLKWVQSISAGVDTLPLQRFAEKKVHLSNGSGIHSESIAEHIMGIILGYSRGLFQAQKAQMNKQWLGDSVHYQALEQQKLLIIGTGHIGKRLAQKASAFGLTCYGINTTGHPVEGMEKTFSLAQLGEVLPSAAIMVNILPLTEQTTGLFDAQLFAQFSPESLFINVGRGASVKTADLIHALDEGQLAFAALDVFEEEPLPATSPLWAMDNVLITPHIAGLTPDFQHKLMAIFLDNLESYIQTGKIRTNQVRLDDGY
ncbi:MULTISPECIES: phosphoglycerate dehydrogenase [unclassified Enterococcus]|uniref:phosphoglycerate dehydrogenase n=1 Tax=unclassified Enterococcus TaxID=2608891 RepID=UPI0013EDEA27|nr:MULTISPECIES: phosphoglycerate dehydrogenase [unclassified Enterococcus]